MRTALTKPICALAAGAVFLFALQAQPQSSEKADKASSHNHSHAEKHSSDDIYKGIFKDSQIESRTLSDWAGDWQSVFPYLQDGTLDPVMEHKAAHGKKTAQEYHAYYMTGYQTEVDRIVIKDDSVTFSEKEGSVAGKYLSDGYEILTYKSGNRGVRYIFKKAGGDEGAPDFIQFSDHRIAPEAADHYHLYWGDDRAALLKEVTNWPTYYPSALSGEEIVKEMTAH
ncbi:ZinT family metal-binding protein [Denitrobaculum tricleocarpae]|uniref:Metal-binding protein ZinT n=1 Tax=Denitrobaculum tricleocarpae TaxID=2591009 RepID=A0A545U331_9PROT|nr:metal-binding protein ZinT [Denitrobaculum tricleocarpae]TQV83823.1 metal-binding protein ZinT [Denitrobaculum tricleocarpae]